MKTLASKKGSSKPMSVMNTSFCYGIRLQIAIMHNIDAIRAGNLILLCLVNWYAGELHLGMRDAIHRWPCTKGV